jgi:hypothetical protein
MQHEYNTQTQVLENKLLVKVGVSQMKSRRQALVCDRGKESNGNLNYNIKHLPQGKVPAVTGATGNRSERICYLSKLS